MSEGVTLLGLNWSGSGGGTARVAVAARGAQRAKRSWLTEHVLGLSQRILWCAHQGVGDSGVHACGQHDYIREEKSQNKEDQRDADRLGRRIDEDSYRAFPVGAVRKVAELGALEAPPSRIRLRGQ